MLSGFLFEFSFHNLREGGSLAAPAYPVHVLRRLQVMEAMAPDEVSSSNVWSSLVMHKLDSNDRSFKLKFSAVIFLRC